MASFSERHGYKEVRTVMQRETLDDESRHTIWNLLAILPGEFDKYAGDRTCNRLLDAVWVWYFREDRDERPRDWAVWDKIKSAVYTAEWNEVLDLLEAFTKYWEQNETPRSASLRRVFQRMLNEMFERHLVGYRMIGSEITPIDSSTESEAIVRAIDDASVVGGARHALNRAVDLFADRTTPDYPNSIKESISAVEAIVKKVTGERTLGAGLRKIEAAGLTIHPALKGAWSQMYGWTSDDDGIRHGGIEAADADQALAKYVLVTCSAFVSYLTEEGRKAGLLR
ncbi:AbiJ-NTD4 domain-containing protein [Microbacterium sp. 22296]|uniref:AbiJ-NTD4 domain-containing protein n=1 Tax=Microbacterium sp. 22296 TaxID=3453903 RepID=UPI003F84C914